MSGVGRVAEETHYVRGVAEAAMAEEKSVHNMVESKVASLAAYAKVSTVHVICVLSKCAKEAAAHSEVQALRVAQAVTQQLEKRNSSSYN